jgi:ribosomal protein L11 methyltransferase
LPQFGEPGLADPKAWARNWLVALLDTDTDVPALLAAAGLAATVEYQLEAVPEQDWVRLTQAQFDPIRISDRLWIVPTWHDAPNAEAINIVLDPGLAFGTGSHPTTRLCLRWLDAHLQAGESLLDYGCGSGILAIAAAKLGAARVWGVDLDPQAVQSAQDNAAANAVTAAFSLPERGQRSHLSLQGESRDDHSHPPRQRGSELLPLQGGGWEGDGVVDDVVDVLVANILTNPLKALMPLLAARVRVGGRIVLSGILVEQADAVMAIYAEQFVMHRWGEDEGWVCLDGVRR